MSIKCYVGTSGWSYEHWKERFYPSKLAKSKWLGFYSQSFSTVELNSSFYHLPTEKAFANWRDSTQDNFVFAVKVSRFITHIKKLKDCEEPVQTFLDRARLLENKLGPLLYQLPPGLHRNDELLEKFLKLLPGDRRHVFEFRHKSWFEREVFDMLKKYNAGFCIFDMPGQTTPLEVASGFAYVRFHGSQSMYGGRYSDEELDGWARRIIEAAAGADYIYVYFNNDMDGFALVNAETLRARLEDLLR